MPVAIRRHWQSWLSLLRAPCRGAAEASDPGRSVRWYPRWLRPVDRDSCHPLGTPQLYSHATHAWLTVSKPTGTTCCAPLGLITRYVTTLVGVAWMRRPCACPSGRLSSPLNLDRGSADEQAGFPAAKSKSRSAGTRCVMRRQPSGDPLRSAPPCNAARAAY